VNPNTQATSRKNGDLAAVTSRLQHQFDFVSDTTQAWVGRQLNNTLNIGERSRTQFLECFFFLAKLEH
jgi:hypothetical protein